MPRSKPSPIGVLPEGARFQLEAYDTPRTGTVLKHSPAGTSVKYDAYVRTFEEKETKFAAEGPVVISAGTAVHRIA